MVSTSLEHPRALAPEPPTDEIVVEAPPRISAADHSNDLLTTVVPMLGSLGSVAVMATMSSAGSVGQTRTLVAAALFLATTLGFAAAQIERQRTRRLLARRSLRASYLRHLESVRQRAREAGVEQRAALLWQHPPPSALPTLAAAGSRTWERRPGDPDFLHVRYAVSELPLSRRLVVPPEADEAADPVCVDALRRLLTVQAVEPDLPVSLELQTLDRIEVCGPRSAARSLVRSLVCSAATFHSPEHLRVAVLAPDDALDHWEWVKWLPHARSPDQLDAVGPRRLVGSRLDELLRLVGARGSHHLLLVVDAETTPPELLPDTTIVAVTPPASTTPALARIQRLSLDHDDRLEPVPADRPTQIPDQCDLATAEAVARRLAAAAVAGSDDARASGRRMTAGDPGLMELLELGDVHRLDPATAWSRLTERDRLRVPIGVGADGPVHLDLKEAARGGVGPHGLLVGATGSGKSELLRTLVLGLTLTHAPDRLNLVLVDFKGGATFAGLGDLPHVSALITNLADDVALVERVQDALAGELVRRQELLRDAGSLASADDYERAREGGAELAPLPSLLIVVDEFSELVAARPEFLDLFVAIGRLGRSLGLHLLVASQHLDEGRLRGLECHLSYRIGLRTFSAQESRAVLGVPDAHVLPSRPGVGLLRTDPSTLVAFRAVHVSAAADRQPRHRDPSRGSSPEILAWTVREVSGTRAPGPDLAARHAGDGSQGRSPETVLTAAVSRMRGAGPAARRIWLPPLTTPRSLDTLLTDLGQDPVLGLVSQRWRAAGRLRLPLGFVDRPREQRRDPFVVDLADAGGHLAVVGAPGSGKSTLLRTLLAVLALTTTPQETQIYVLDFGGGSCAGLHGLPQVAGAATRSEPDVVRRIVAEVGGILERREAFFRTQDLDSIDSYRRLRGRSGVEDGYGDVVLVVDGWGSLRHDFDDLEPELQALAGRGATYGLHLVAATSRWADFRPAVRDLLGTRVELRLGDPVDSEVDRRVAALVPVDQPGRGLTSDGAHLLTALPRIDGIADPGSLGQGVADLVARVAGSWAGPAGPKLRLLPEHLTLASVLADPSHRRSPGLVLGLDERDLKPVRLHPDTDPHWLVLGDGGSGKSAALRAYLQEVMRTRTPREAQVVVLDYRRALLGEVPDDYLLHYLTSAAQAMPALTDLADRLHRRLPGPEVTPDQLRDRSWWTGPEAFVVVDDYDLVTASHASPVHVLVPLLSQARDVGLHLVVARRTGGASRALYEPVIQALRELSAPGLVLSGSPEEGVLLGGVRPGPAPPGRGRLITRDRGVEVVQLAWHEPAY